MFSSIELHRLTPKDVDDYYDHFDANRSHLAEHDPRLAHEFMTISQVAEAFSPFNAKYKQHFAILKDGEFAGSTFLSLRQNQEAEIGYWVDRSHLRQGIAAAACQQLVNRTFLDTDTRYVEALIAPENKASIRTIERVGFQYDRALEEDLVYVLDAREVGRRYRGIF